jgi:hypothetical protein
MNLVTLAPAAFSFILSTAIILRWRHTARRDATPTATA